MNRDHFRVIVSDGDHVAILGDYRDFDEAVNAGLRATRPALGAAQTEYFEILPLVEDVDDLDVDPCPCDECEAAR